WFIHGNRDFLLGRGYARRAGMSVLAEPSVVMLYGRPALLSHGDTLCTGDVAYQQFRAQTRDPSWQARFLGQPLEARLAFARQAREASRAHQSGLADQGTMETITDVAPEAVAATFALYGVDLMIHGHTHRPAVHQPAVDGRGRQRIVLGDWYEQGSVLRVGRGGARREALAGPARPGAAGPASSILSSSSLKPASLRASWLNGPGSTARAYCASNRRKVGSGSKPARSQCQRNQREPAATWATSSRDRKSTRLNSSHVKTSYAVFC